MKKDKFLIWSDKEKNWWKDVEGERSMENPPWCQDISEATVYDEDSFKRMKASYADPGFFKFEKVNKEKSMDYLMTHMGKVGLEIKKLKKAEKKLSKLISEFNQ